MKTSILTLGLLIFTLGVSAQDIKLPNPDMKAKSSTVIDALAKRHSTREFASTPLSIVTGGSQGIGKCIADEFLKNGAHVCVIDKQEGEHFVGDISRKEVPEEFARY